MMTHLQGGKRLRPTALVAGLVLLAAAVGGTVVADTARSGAGQPPGARLREARAALPVEPGRLRGTAPRERSRLFRGTLSRAKVRVPDFTTYADAARRKEDFFAWMLPLVEQENARLRGVRRHLAALFDQVRWGRDLSTRDRRWLADLAREFRIQDADPATAAFWRTAFERVDALPVELVAVQAANESGWGTSRFAREGNNLFGQWCFRPGCGIVPLERPEGASYEVARFESPAESVGSYMRNLNTGRSYQLLRRIRADHRGRGRNPEAAELAAGLIDYSERGGEYIDEIRAMLRVNTPVIADVRVRLDDPQDQEG